MLWLFRRILDRLLVKSAVHAASDLEAQMELAASETQASLLRRAYELEQENVPGLDQVAAGLRARAASMAGENGVPGGDISGIVSILRAEDLREEVERTRPAIGSEAVPVRRAAPAAPRQAAKKRGRPRKMPAVDLVITDWRKPDALPDSAQSQDTP